MSRQLAEGDGGSAAATRAFYDEYSTVMDLPAEFYLETLERVFQRHDLAHGTFRVHGELVDPGAIEQSRILFSAESKNAAADYLFLKEAYDLPLTGVELAVLSACDTERGKPLPGEGIESFSRAFLAAGAQTTVTTLWRVPDQTTAAFMRLYYHHLQRGESRAAALRLTKLRFLTAGGPTANPHYWAPFVLTGDGLRPVSTAVRWRSVVLWLAVVLIAAGVIARRVGGRGRGPRRRPSHTDREVGPSP